MSSLPRDPDEPFGRRPRSSGHGSGGGSGGAGGRGVRGEQGGGGLPLRIRAWDGSEAGAPADSGAPVVVLNHRRALRRLLWQPGEMGLAHAYVSGDLDVDGDLGAGLTAMWALFRDGAITTRRPRLGELPGLVGTAARLGLLGPKPAPPPEAITLPRFARLHSKLRDRAVIAHHYDAGNDFYELILDENMAYSSGYWADLAAAPTTENLVAAQDAKLDMICRKLDLRPGSTLLDVGCGWGSLPIHAAKHYGAHVRGVTIAVEQRDHISQRIRAEGLADRVQVDLVDYRDIATHIEEYGSVRRGVEHRDGRARRRRELPDVRRHAVRGGAPRRSRARAADVAPARDHPGGGAVHRDLRRPRTCVMRPVGDTLDAAPARRARGPRRPRHAGALRADLPGVDRAPSRRRWDRRGRARRGSRGARMWRLYLVGAALAFEENRMGVDQILLGRVPRRRVGPACRPRGSRFEPARGSVGADTPTA